ncbi:MAG: LuxR C-terminal-related transcriptional regulator [Planctomycetaceae bacterium]
MISKQPKSTILVACDTRLSAQALSWGLECHLQEMQVVSVWSLEELKHRFHMEAPVLVLLDEAMAMQAIRILSGFVEVRVRNSRLAVLANELTQGQLSYVVHNRVTGLISRDRSLPELARELGLVISGSPVVAEEFVEHVQSGRDGFLEPRYEVAGRLTDRQLEVLIRIAEGNSVREVASQLRISHKSVESHKYRGMKTLQIDDRVDLCRWAIREGLIKA